MQSLDVQAQNPAKPLPVTGTTGNHAGHSTAMNGKTGAETARNGSSFLAMIEKMIAGTKDGKTDAHKAALLKTTGRGAGDALSVPGDKHTLIKSGSGKTVPTAVQAKQTHDAALQAQKLKKLRDEKDHHSIPHSAHQATPVSPEAKAVGHAGMVIEEAKANAAEMSGDAKAAGKKTGHALSGIPEGTAVLAMAGMTSYHGAHQAVAEKTGHAENAESGGAKIGKAERKDKKTLINVRDERSDALAADKGNPLTKSVQVNTDSTADMTIGFRTDGTGSSSLSDSGSRLTEAQADQKGQSFASMLSSELRDNAADFVKTGSIVLRDNNAGLIRLTLHPESLGNVKISLEMSSDKKITGKIVVSSKEAYDAFNENLDGLSDAFVQGGFESAGFDLSWSGQDSAGYGEKEKAAAVSSPYYASAIPDVMSGADTADRNRSGYGNSGQTAINVFA